ncbi:MAG: glutaminyl-peptide cyclotransferase [Pseudomonadota bacterium]
MTPNRITVFAIAAFVLPCTTAFADLPILHDGEAPQIGEARVYSQPGIPVYRYEILKTYPHDTADYTEALFMHEGYLFEGTGQYGKSRLKKWDLETGEVLRRFDLDPRFFGEGAVALDDRLYHLTYISNTGFVYRPDDLTPVSQFNYTQQGWGLTTDGERLIMSNGSASVLFIDPDDFTVERTIIVRDAYSTVGFLNELEYVDGDIYANIWQTDFIVRFSAETGRVNGWIDLRGLNPEPDTLVYPHVLNGIAYNGEPDTLLVTGKNWPYLWHIRLVPVAER